MIDLGKQWPLNISFFADNYKCLAFANLDAIEPTFNLRLNINYLGYRRTEKALKKNRSH